MKAREPLTIALFLHLIFFIEISSRAFLFTSADCILKFDQYPYEPEGECVGVDEKTTEWDSIQIKRCCRNALETLSVALALQAQQKDSLFISEDQWTECNNTFSRQSSVSISTCGISKLHTGNGNCSDLTLSSFVSRDFYAPFNAALRNCSQLVWPSSFDDSCKNCSQAIKDARNHVVDQLGVNNSEEDVEICGVAVVIAVVTQTISDHAWYKDFYWNDSEWVGDFYRCLPALEGNSPGYIKLKYSIAKAVLAILIATMGLILVVLLIKFVTKKKNPPKPIEGKEISTWSGLYRFSNEEIQSAINHSSQKISLGSGSAGRVYKGVLPSGQIVAIKHINKTPMSDSFTREVEGLSRIRHPNLVCLFGCCVEGREQYLVYEYCANGNLAQHLLRSDRVLPWDKRVGILRECALALRFLHNYPDGCIVHRDVKLTNILLTERMEPKLSDFGLAKMLGMEESKVFTDVRGTIGYMDPEYMTNAKLTPASDVYSFGIVALQLLSGRKVIELDIDARDQLTRKAKDVISGKRPFTDFEDRRLKGQLIVEDFEGILKIAVLCVAKSSKGRPSMHDVFVEMDGAWLNTNAKMSTRFAKETISTATSSPLTQSTMSTFPSTSSPEGFASV